MRFLGPLLLIAGLAPIFARHTDSLCGTTRESTRESIFLHRQAVRARASLPGYRAQLQTAAPTNRDIGNIAIIEDAAGVVARQNQFNLDGKTLQFTPTSSGGYRYSVADQGYDSAAVTAGTPLSGLGDDDSRLVALPFAFPFYGASYSQINVNSDGNLTFTAPDTASNSRSLGRVTGGPPRIAPLFDDLDPSRAADHVRVLAEPSRVVVSWDSVPEWGSSGFGFNVVNTFQVRLYPDGRIEFSYFGTSATDAVVGLAPGGARGDTSIVDFRNDPSAEYSGAIAEVFGSQLQIDLATVAQRFYQTHDDSYDYLVVYNNEDIAAGTSAVAYADIVRSHGAGFGTDPIDYGSVYGSAARLQAALNLGHLSQYPKDPNAPVPTRRAQGDTPVTVVAHEAGHLFLARVSVPDPDFPLNEPMLNANNLVHWRFTFNSEASLLEGERIADNGAGVSPRFLTTGTVEGYSPLDQYLMGFRPPSEVPPTFWVGQAPASLAGSLPFRGVSFDGVRHDVTIDDVIAAAGRRTPDSAVAQRRFRFGFILVVAAGSQPSADDLARVEGYRQQFETFFPQAASGNAVADSSLKRSLRLSMFPAAGVVSGGTASGTVTIASARQSDLAIQFQTANGNAGFPSSVTIPAGSSSAAFSYSGLRPGVENVAAIASDSAYETAAARIQVADASNLKLTAVAAAPGSVAVRLSDANDLPYAGARIAAASTGSAVTPDIAATDAAGIAVFQWTPSAADANELQLTVEAIPAVKLVIAAGGATPVIAEVDSAASFSPGVAAGALEMIKGTRLAGGAKTSADYPWPVSLGGVRVLLDSMMLPLVYVSDQQINFYVPQTAPTGAATLTVIAPSGVRATTPVTIQPVQPGIFPSAVFLAGTRVSASSQPVAAGDYLEIYCTGLGATRSLDGFERTLAAPDIWIGGARVTPVYSGLASSVPGVYQVNAQVPAGLAPGSQPVWITAGSARSNEITIQVR